MFNILLWPFKLLGFLVMSLVGLLLLVSCVFTLTGFWGEKGWWWDISSHFRLQYLWVQLLAFLWASVPLILRRKTGRLFWLQWGVLLVFVSLNLSQVLPYYWPQPVPDNLLPGKVKILHSNVLFANHNTEAVARLIREKDPDILTLAEYTNEWQVALQQTGVLQRYPYRQLVPYSEDGIYSKIPFQKVGIDYRRKGEDATARLDLSLLGRPVTLVLVHPVNPVLQDWYRRQGIHFDWWVSERPKYRENLILMGDLNTAPWSSSFRHLIRETGLRDSQEGFGLQPSWPRRTPILPVELLPLIPIDHVLVSEKFVVLKRELGPDVGSDHLPIYVELGLRAEE